ncbi:MAG: hypothetical protein KDA80_08775 [Planctomycetaceae bacterium]|nr:hypothetical protein [Planctomycetaceae bacterium]
MDLSPRVYVHSKIARVIRLFEDLSNSHTIRFPIHQQLDRRAHRLKEAHTQGNEAVVPIITSWHPTLSGATPDMVLGGPFSLCDSRETVAREHGYSNWEAALSQGTIPPNRDFELAVDVLLSGDIDHLRQLLRRDGSLAHRRSRFGHEATLLHYLGANGVETERQVVPLNSAVLAKLLIDTGSNVNATAKVYGESTPLELLMTSQFPAEAGVRDDVRDILLAAGAIS